MLEMLFFDLSLLFAKASFAVFLLKLLIIAIIVFAIIGIITTIKFFIGRRRNKETNGQYWLRTGKMKK